MDGVYYELRDPRNANFAGKKRDGRIVLHQELGQVDRSIKLEITTNRKLHDSTRYFDVGTTILQREQIIRIGKRLLMLAGQAITDQSLQLHWSFADLEKAMTSGSTTASSSASCWRRSLVARRTRRRSRQFSSPSPC